jgi:hypothetical protein
MSDEQREKMREAAQARPPISNTTRDRMREAHKARAPISDATRERLRAAQKGHAVSESGRENMSRAAKARRPRSDCAKEKVSEWLRKAHKEGHFLGSHPARHIITTPEGEELLVNFSAFCRDHGLSYNGMMHALRTGAKHKGYSARRAA